MPDISPHSKTILPLDSDEATLDRVGGKGANLSRLARAGYPVPAGFLVTTEAYRVYVAANDLGARIVARVNGIRPDAPEELETASHEIRAWFAEGVVPAEFVAELRNAYDSLSHPPVAVRSSATAEDLPDMSFAGQQDTFLNVIGEEALLAAVVKCWSSLWTARAIGYRARNGIPPDNVALAVVAQAMVSSEASGVLFTANPLTGLRTETVIDAAVGLGEALVSGQVEPDHYVVETAKGRISSKTLGAKALAIREKTGGGVITIHQDASQHQALADEQIRTLTSLGQRVAAEYNSPQDIEWAWAGGRLSLLQSRPITSLYPVPDDLPAEPLRVMFSFGAVQGVLDPMTPLGQDAIRFAVSGLGSALGFGLTYDTQKVFRLAGERVWVDFTAVIRSRVGRNALNIALPMIEPSVAQALQPLWDDPRLAPGKGGVSPSLIVRLAPHLFPLVIRVVRYLLDPDGRRKKAIEETEEFLARLRAKCAATGDRQTKLTQRIAVLRELSHAFPQAIPTLITGLVAGMVSFNVLNRLAAHLSLDDPFRLVLEATRGLPHNVTTEMDLRLWETARAIRSDPAASAQFRTEAASQLAADYLAGKLPGAAQEAIRRFVEGYGVRGIAEIDFGRQRWREDPTPLMQALQSYLRIEDGSRAPDVVFKRGEEAALAAMVRIEEAARGAPRGWLKARLVRLFGYRMRSLMGLRESPKFFIVRMMGVIREGLLDSGREFVEAGPLAEADDLFFLHLPEVEELASGASRDWATLIAERRAVFQREKLRRQIPRLLVSDGRAVYEGLTDAAAGEGVIVGSPVSPGVVEGVVRVVLDPHGSQLSPGEILVCPGTDPAWTPLFLAAGGLVMEVGGLMTHGSVVAREYGIPAVVGVDRATQRLKTGQRIRVDGSSGKILVLET